MAHAKVYYQGTGKKDAVVSGEIVEVTDRWVRLIPDDESVEKMLIPYSRGPIIQYSPNPHEQAGDSLEGDELNNSEFRGFCDACGLIKSFTKGRCESCHSPYTYQGEF